MRMEADQRRAMIVTSAINLANAGGLNAVNFTAVARGCVMKTTARTVRHYFKRNADLWVEVALDKRGNPDLRDEAIAMGLKL